MRVSEIHIVNFRSFADETVCFSDYTCLVGPNGSGKSTVLAALNVFFRQPTPATPDPSSLQDEDFHFRNTAEPVELTVTFEDLNEDAKADLKDYERQGKLFVTARAVFDEQTQRAEVRQFGQRLGLQDFRAFFEADKNKASVADLKEIYVGFRAKYKDLVTS
jgi:predicted ATP-dependent endonuclease of OLD family